MERLKDQYELLWIFRIIPDILSWWGSCKSLSIRLFQRTPIMILQNIRKESAGTRYLKGYLKSVGLGVKNLYYHNTRDGASDKQEDLESSDCAGGACKI